MLVSYALYRIRYCTCVYCCIYLLTAEDMWGAADFTSHSLSSAEGNFSDIVYLF
jgi:hypothetical protein